MQMTEYEQRNLEAFEKSINEGKWSNDGMVSMLKLLETYLGLKRVSEFAKEEGKSTQALRRRSNIIKLCGYAMAIDNE